MISKQDLESFKPIILAAKKGQEANVHLLVDMLSELYASLDEAMAWISKCAEHSVGCTGLSLNCDCGLDRLLLQYSAQRRQTKIEMRAKAGRSKPCTPKS